MANTRRVVWIILKRYSAPKKHLCQAHYSVKIFRTINSFEVDRRSVTGLEEGLSMTVNVQAFLDDAQGRSDLSVRCVEEVVVSIRGRCNPCHLRMGCFIRRTGSWQC